MMNGRFILPPKKNTTTVVPTHPLLPVVPIVFQPNTVATTLSQPLTKYKLYSTCLTQQNSTLLMVWNDAFVDIASSHHTGNIFVPQLPSIQKLFACASLKTVNKETQPRQFFLFFLHFKLMQDLLNSEIITAQVRLHILSKKYHVFILDIPVEQNGNN